ncbi:hypothetical protein [Kitasatospora purpeofusca]
MAYSDGTAPIDQQPQPTAEPRTVERGDGASVIWPQPDPQPAEPTR